MDSISAVGRLEKAYCIWETSKHGYNQEGAKARGIFAAKALSVIFQAPFEASGRLLVGICCLPIMCNKTVRDFAIRNFVAVAMLIRDLFVAVVALFYPNAVSWIISKKSPSKDGTGSASPNSDNSPPSVQSLSQESTPSASPLPTRTPTPDKQPLFAAPEQRQSPEHPYGFMLLKRPPTPEKDPQLSAPEQSLESLSSDSLSKRAPTQDKPPQSATPRQQKAKKPSPIIPTKSKAKSQPSTPTKEAPKKSCFPNATMNPKSKKAQLGVHFDPDLEHVREFEALSPRSRGSSPSQTLTPDSMPSPISPSSKRSSPVVTLSPEKA
jgi:hypothetical protein